MTEPHSHRPHTPHTMPMSSHQWHQAGVHSGHLPEHNHEHEHDGHEHEDDDHHHAHSHIPSDKKILAISFVIITGFMLIEFWGGWHFNSLALSADAGHMANDSVSLLLALLALFLSQQTQKWFALLNGLSLVVIAIVILVEAVGRWLHPLAIQALPMLMIAVLGLVVNLVVAWLMLKSTQENLNIKAAYLHVVADVFGSVVAIVAGLSAYFLHWQWVDIVASVLLSLFILKSGLQVSKQAWHNLKA